MDNIEIIKNMVISKKYACHQSDCPVANTGECLEGLEMSDCEHFYLEEGEISDDSIEDTIKKANVNTIKLFPGDELSIDDTSFLTYNASAKIIVIAGESYSGKTTILSTLFDLFQKGSFANLSFAGSFSQIGFEKRCFYSRITSGRTKSDTQKTISSEFNFLHLSLKSNSEDYELKNLLITDVSGERFQLARDNDDDMKSLSLLQSADYICLLIDGEKLSKNSSRQSTLKRAESFIARAVQNNVLNKKMSLDVLISKADLIDNEVSRNFLDHLVKTFEIKFKEKLKKLNFIKIAARPNTITDTFNTGYGLDVLIKTWFFESLQYRDPHYRDSVTDNERNFLNYKVEV